MIITSRDLCRLLLDKFKEVDLHSEIKFVNTLPDYYPKPKSEKLKFSLLALIFTFLTNRLNCF